MAAKIGILGENTTLVRNVEVTVYTVPADKAARIRILFIGEGLSSGTNSRYSVLIGSPGSEITIHSNQGSSEKDLWTGLLAEATPDPALSTLSRVAGIQDKVGGVQLDLLTSEARWVIAPLPFDYFLSTGDTVRWQLDNAGNNWEDHLIQVQGVEDDA